MSKRLNPASSKSANNLDYNMLPRITQDECTSISRVDQLLCLHRALGIPTSKVDSIKAVVTSNSNSTTTITNNIRVASSNKVDTQVRHSSNMVGRINNSKAIIIIIMRSWKSLLRSFCQRY